MEEISRNVFNLSPIGVIIFKINRFEFLQLRMSISAVSLQCPTVVKHLRVYFTKIYKQCHSQIILTERNAKV